MEDVLMIWSSEAPSLEALQPLSFSAIDEHEESINLDKLSRSEIAGKLLDHLDQIAEGQETEPFDWFANEKSIDLPIIFENISSGIQNNYCKAGTQPSQYCYFDSPEYEPTFVPTNYGFGGSAVAGATQPQLTYAPPPFNAGPAGPIMTGATMPATTTTTTTTTSISNMFVPPAGIPTSPQFVDCDPKKEVLTPPDSPKEQEEILRILQEIEGEHLEKLMMFGKRSENEIEIENAEAEAEAETMAPETSTTFTPSATAIDTNVLLSAAAAVAADSCLVDDLSDYAASSSPYVCSESSSDNDADYVPRGGASRRVSGERAVGGRRRASKPASSRHSIEERRLRKKEQNKNAATRYRMKKKQEVEACKNEEQLLADRNRELRNKVDDISREIKCLKSLMRDVYRKKGLIK